MKNQGRHLNLTGFPRERQVKKGLNIQKQSYRGHLLFMELHKKQKDE